MRKTLTSRMRDRFITVLTAAALGITGWAVTGVSAPDEAQAASSVGGKITRTEVLARAADWYSRRNDSDMTYSQSAKTWRGGHTTVPAGLLGLHQHGLAHERRPEHRRARKLDVHDTDQPKRAETG